MKKIILSILVILSSYSVYAQLGVCDKAFYNNLQWSVNNGFDNLEKWVNPPYSRHDDVLSMSMTHHEFYDSNIPSGWRLPTKAEFLQLLRAACRLKVYPNVGYFSFENSSYRYGCKIPVTFDIPMEVTYGTAFGGYRETIGCKASYLVKEGVISISHSRPLRGELPRDFEVILLDNPESVKFVIDEYAKFEATFDKRGYVRLVRDL